MQNYGKLRKEDVPLLEEVVVLFRKHGFHAGLHGTSLWNKNYKDIDLLVVSPRGRPSHEGGATDSAAVKQFFKALEEIKKMGGKVLSSHEDEKVGLDYDIELDTMMLHLSYVILL